MNYDIFHIFLALIPLAVVLFLMLGRNWPGSQAGPAGWLAAVLLALTAFGGDTQLLWVASGRSLLLSLYVLYIIWMALLLYNVVNEAGVIQAIGQELPKLAEAKAVQVLLLAWIFGSFLQGASGFGVPAAVVAPLLIGLGFEPTVAVVAALMGHGWAVSFGSLGASFVTLTASSGLPEETLAGPSAAFLALACLGCGAAVLWATNRWQALREQAFLLLALSVVMGFTQWFLAVVGLWSIGSFGAGLVGLLVMVAWLRTRPHRPDGFRWRKLGEAFFPYAILTAVIVLGEIILADQLDFLTLNYTFPAVETSRGWHTAAGEGRGISLFGHPGALLLYVSGLAFAWYSWRGTLSTTTTPYQASTIGRKALKSFRAPTISIISLVAMATTMQLAGMTQVIAETLSNTGPLFPFLSPFIAALGAFMTGSNTNSNVLFAQLQRHTAEVLELSVPFILAGQSAGGALGSVFAPAKVIVGCSTVPGVNDSAVLKLATLYGCAILLLISLLTALVS